MGREVREKKSFLKSNELISNTLYLIKKKIFADANVLF